MDKAEEAGITEGLKCSQQAIGIRRRDWTGSGTRPRSPTKALHRNDAKAERWTALDVNDLRLRVRSGLDDGNLTVFYLWIKFWANGGPACRADMDAFVHCLQEPSDDVLVVGAVIELRHT